MDTKPIKRKRGTGLFPYKAEDLEPRNMADEVAAKDAYIERNRDDINAALKKGYDGIERGHIHAAGQVASDLAKQRRARRGKS